MIFIQYIHFLIDPIIHIIRGVLNVHASLLPRWRGAAPIAHAIINGDTKTGISIMEVKAHQ
jgi:methionyl-tRNA formyltransferase